MRKRQLFAVFISLLLIWGAAAHAQETEDFISFQADSLRVTADDRVVAVGNVRATYRDYTVTSERAETNPEGTIATFEENVVLSANGIDVRGERLTLDLQTRDWELLLATSTLTPQALRGNVLEPVFVGGREITGTEDDEVSVRAGSLTTCNLPEPHYVLTAREVDVFPARKLVARGVTFYALNRRIFSLPSFSIPLNRLRSRTNLIPQVGQTEAEGVFVKSAYNYMATEQQSGLVRLDLMSRKGFAQGLEHTYNFAQAVGSLTLYHLFDRTLDTNSLTGRLSHRQEFGGVVMDLVSDYRQNSYLFAPATTTSNNRLVFSRDREAASSQLRIDRTATTGIGTFETLTSSLTHRQRLFGANGNFVVDFGRFGNPFQETDNEELTTRFELSRQMQRYDWRFNFSKRFDLDDDDIPGTTFATLDRLPELILESDTTRLGRRLLPYGVPAALALSVGRYNEEPLGVDTERVMFEANTRSQPLRIGDRWSGNAAAGFRQAVYGNQAAQYVVRANTDLRRRLGERSSFDLRYRYQQPRGASAFRFDFVGRYNVLTARLNLQETETFRLSLNTGYNFAFTALPWQDISLRAVYAPSQTFLIYTSTGYDVNRSRWRELINQLRLRLPSGLNLDLGTRYDIERGQLGTVRAQLETPLGSLTRLQAVAGYSGFLNRFDYKAIQITRDLHCWEASLVYVDQSDFYAEKGFRFNLRIKAFPVFQQFGVGQRGQSLLDTSVGDQF